MTVHTKKMLASASCLALFLATAGMSASPGISLKLDGGLSKLRIGDTNTNITELARNWENVSGQRGFHVPGKLGTMGRGMEGEAEIMLKFRPFLAVGLGFGRILDEKNGNRMEMALPPPIRHQIQAQDNEISSMPVFINLYYLRPIFPGGTIFARLGAGYYVTKWHEKGRYDEETSEKAPWWREWEIDAKANGPGFTGGIGLEYSLIRRISVAVEVFGRACKISGFKGDGAVRRSYSEPSSYPDGTLYYYEWKDDLTSDWYGDVNLRTDTPGSATEINVRKAEVDLSGVGVKLGLIIRLM